MADDVTCPACDERIPLVASRAKGVKCPACGTQVLKPDLEALAREKEEKEKTRAERAERAERRGKKVKAAKTEEAGEATGKIKTGSAPRKRRDDDDYDHDHPQERRPRRSSSGNGGVIAGLVLTVLVVISIGAGVVYLIRGKSDKPGAPPAVAGPNQTPFPAPNPVPLPNPNVNPNPGPNPGPIFGPPPGVPVPHDTSAAEKALPTFEPPFDVDPLLEKPDRPVYLADMKEFAVRMGPWQFGKGELGNGAKTPIKVKGVAAEKGLSVHPSDRAATRVAYALGGKATALAGKVGLSDPDPVAWDPVVFVVVGDGKELWRSGPIKGDTGPQSFRADVTGVKVLELRAVATGSHYGAHAAWVDPVIEK